MRALGIDLGRRRIGLAVSDPSGTLARPLTTLVVDEAGSRRGGSRAVNAVVQVIGKLREEEDGLALVVVGVPTSLDGRATPQTAEATAFMAALGRAVPIPVVGEDERLTSHEADQRLAARERDWARRKPRLDAAAAAIILQTYLDRRAPPALGDEAGGEGR
jgi:putative Holliday junction resolvase